MLLTMKKGKLELLAIIISGGEGETVGALSTISSQFTCVLFRVFSSLYLFCGLLFFSFSFLSLLLPCCSGLLSIEYVSIVGYEELLCIKQCK